MAYDLIRISNSTNYSATGTVHLASAFCSNDRYSADANTTWTQSRRGVCLLDKISAILVTPEGTVEAAPYVSSGTSYSQFAILQTAPGQFQVTRLISAGEDHRPADHQDPTEPQK